MRKKALFTTGEVAAHCGVSYEAVKEWIKTGKLKAYATPGKHRRIPTESFKQFLQKYHWPLLGEAERPTARRRVLVVDDDSDIISLIMKGLSRIGEYELASATDGFEAGLQVLTFHPDLIILDLMMPQMDGFKVCQKIKSAPETRGILVLAITGYPTPENVQKILEAGADYYLVKPFKVKALQQIIREIFAGTYRMPQTA